VVARTGYTGGDGFELFVASEGAVQLWNALLGAGGSPVPVGLGARDTLRLEAGLLLHGADMGPTTSALEASLDWVVKLDAEPFIGRDALATEAKVGPRRRLVRLVLKGTGVPRHGCEIRREGQRIGVVTSGTMSPMLRKGIALGFVDRPHHHVGTGVAIDIRGRTVDAEIVRGPFYPRRSGPSKSGVNRPVGAEHP
jgi:aminomethyltransferase